MKLTQISKVQHLKLIKTNSQSLQIKNTLIIPSKLNKPPVTIKFYLNSTLISQTITENYLGITIDTELKFNNQMIRTRNIEDIWNPFSILSSFTSKRPT